MLDVNFADPKIQADPFPLFARLRLEEPVHWSPRMKSWVLTRYDDVKRVALNNAEISADRLAPFFAATEDSPSRYASLMAYLGNWLVFRDPPQHTRLRGLFTKAFTSRSVQDLQPNIEQIVDYLLDDMDARSRRGEPLDWVADFAYALPATVIMDLLGVPREDLKKVKIWSDEIALFIGTAKASADKYARAEAGSRAMADYFRGIVAERSRDPRNDIISQLTTAKEGREVLTTDEIIATCILLLFAGHETTTNMIVNGLYYSLLYRDQWDRLRADRALVDPAIEEWLRYDGPSNALARVVTRDIEIGGKTLQKGQRVFAFLNAANRDPEQFENADSFDIGRNPNPHLTFGHGIHFCLGAPLARLEGQIALKSLLDRHPDIRLQRGLVPHWHDSLIMRGITHMPIHLR